MDADLVNTTALELQKIVNTKPNAWKRKIIKIETLFILKFIML